MTITRPVWMAWSFVLAATIVLSPFATAFVRAQAGDTAQERVAEWSFVGQMIELSTTEAPTNIVVRDFDDDGEGWTDYTVLITAETVFGTNRTDTTVMADWITGDWVLVQGEFNENTRVVTASAVVNQSINPYQDEGLNGWVTAMDAAAGTMTVDWAGVSHVIQVTDRTKMVVPPINPATLADFQAGDRVRLRLFKDGESENEARIIVALRRGDHIYLKGRTRPFEAGLVSFSGGAVPAELEVVLFENEHLRGGDVNNLIGIEGERKIVIVDEYTQIVRRYEGETTLSTFLPGDDLYIVGRSNDDGSITAKLIRNDEVLATDVDGLYGRVDFVDVATRSITVRGGGAGPREVHVPLEAVIWHNDGEAEFEEIAVGDRVRVRGVWSDAASTGPELVASTVFAWSDVAEADDRIEDEDLDDIEEDEIQRLSAEMCAASEPIVEAVESVELEEVESEEVENEEEEVAVEDGSEEVELEDLTEEEFADLLEELFGEASDASPEDATTDVCEALTVLEDEQEDVDVDDETAGVEEEFAEDTLEDELEDLCAFVESGELVSDAAAGACEELAREVERSFAEYEDRLAEVDARLDDLTTSIDALAEAGGMILDEAYGMIFEAAFDWGFASGFGGNFDYEIALEYLDQSDDVLDTLEDIVENLEAEQFIVQP